MVNQGETSSDWNSGSKTETRNTTRGDRAVWRQRDFYSSVAQHWWPRLLTQSVRPDMMQLVTGFLVKQGFWCWKLSENSFCLLLESMIRNKFFFSIWFWVNDLMPGGETVFSAFHLTSLPPSPCLTHWLKSASVVQCSILCSLNDNIIFIKI